MNHDYLICDTCHNLAEPTYKLYVETDACICGGKFVYGDKLISKLEKRILVLARAMIKLAFRHSEHEDYFTDDEVIKLCTDEATAELRKEGKI